LKEYAILENIENDRKTIVLTFWDNRVDMENYYSKNDKILSDQVEIFIFLQQVYLFE
jgi:hypothetical protein